MTDELVRLNLGAGNTPLAGYENLDIKAGFPAYPLKHPPNSVDEIRASHLLEHFSEHEAINAVADWVRCLKPGGLLKLAVPDFEWVVGEYAAVDDPARKNLLRAFVMGGQTDEHDMHNSTWTQEKLVGLMKMFMLEDICTWQSAVQDCASMPVSLNLQGRKPLVAPEPQKVLRMAVTAVMSVPRFMVSANIGCAMGAFFALRIPFLTHTGAFWHQTLTNVLEKALDDGADIIITLDYDTIFTRQDVEYLLVAMDAHPEFDALMGALCKREGDYGLITQRDEDDTLRQTITLEEMSQEFLPAASGHFGLTAFRAEKIRTLSRPWFVAVPDKDGRWVDSSRLDADMYFWKKWREEGRNLHLAQKVRLGHVQDLVTWPRMDFQGVHQYIHDFREHGMPEEARYRCPQSDS